LIDTSLTASDFCCPTKKEDERNRSTQKGNQLAGSLRRNRATRFGSRLQKSDDTEAAVLNRLSRVGFASERRTSVTAMLSPIAAFAFLGILEARRSPSTAAVPISSGEHAKGIRRRNASALSSLARRNLFISVRPVGW
jgi:hypothetical protein